VKYLVPLLIVSVLASSCTKDYMEIPMSAMTSEESRVAAYQTIGDASTAKEAIVHKTWQNYHDEYQEAYEDSGLTMSYKEVKLSDGSTTFLPVISYKPPPTMAAPPTEPSQHPVWKTVDNVVNRGIMWAGIGWIAHEFRGMNEAAYDAAGNTYNGPTNMAGSYNTAGNDQTTTTGTQYQDQRKDSEGCSNGNCNGEDVESETEMCIGERGTIPVSELPENCSCGSWQNHDC